MIPSQSVKSMEDMSLFKSVKVFRSPSGEDGSGGGDLFYSGGADEAGAAAAPDRTSMLESRLDKMATSLDAFMSNQTADKKKAEVNRVEGQIASVIREQDQALDAAETALAEAFDDGDGRTIAKAQRAVAEQAAKRERVLAQAEQYRENAKNSEKRVGGQRTAEELDTTNLDQWKQQQSNWYGVDKEMTKYAHELDSTIRAAGVISSGSKEYFEAINRQMKNKFPDRFSGTPPTGGASGDRGAPAPSAGRQRIAASVADGYRRMGINIDDPEVAKRMVRNREKAVAKGWLSETPNTGRIFQR